MMMMDGIIEVRVSVMNNLSFLNLLKKKYIFLYKIELKSKI